MTGSAPDIFDLIRFGGLSLPRFDPGEFWLAGAGPGDPGLLALHAVNALSRADIILFDALVHEAVVFESAGKRGGQPSANQRNITTRLIEFARQGHWVLRLEGGGLPRGTPVAIGSDATTPRQRVPVTSLMRAAADVAAQGLGVPAIIAIGEMVELRAALTPSTITLAVQH